MNRRHSSSDEVRSKLRDFKVSSHRKITSNETSSPSASGQTTTIPPLAQLTAQFEMISRTQIAMREKVNAMHAEKVAETKMRDHLSQGRKIIPVGFLLEHNGRFVCQQEGAEKFALFYLRKLKEYQVFYFYRWVQITQKRRNVERLMRRKLEATTKILHRLRRVHNRFKRRALKVWKRRAKWKTRKLQKESVTRNAVVIQRAFRRYLHRCSVTFRLQTAAAVEIQRLVRGTQLRHSHFPAMKVQRCYRYYRYRRWIHIYVTAFIEKRTLWTGTCLMQALVRRRVRERQYLGLRRGWISFQRVWRRYKCSRHSAASILQNSVYRSWKRKMVHKRHTSATKLQRFFVSQTETRKAMFIHTNCVRIQAWFRMMRYFIPYRKVMYNNRRLKKRKQILARWTEKVQGVLCIVTAEFVDPSRTHLVVYQPDSQQTTIFCIKPEDSIQATQNRPPPVVRGGRRSMVEVSHLRQDPMSLNALKVLGSSLRIQQHAPLQQLRLGQTDGPAKIEFESHSKGNNFILPLNREDAMAWTGFRFAADAKRSLWALCQPPLGTASAAPVCESRAKLSCGREHKMMVLDKQGRRIGRLWDGKALCQTVLMLNGSRHIVSVHQFQTDLIAVAYSTESSETLECTATLTRVRTILRCFHSAQDVWAKTSCCGSGTTGFLVNWLLDRLQIAPWYSVLPKHCCCFRGDPQKQLGELELFFDHREQTAANTIVHCWKEYCHFQRRRNHLLSVISKQRDPESGLFYYVNNETHETSWQKPPGLGGLDVPLPQSIWLPVESSLLSTRKFFNPRTGWTTNLRQDEAAMRIQRWQHQLLDSSVLHSLAPAVRVLRLIKKAELGYRVDPERMVSKVNYFLTLFAVHGDLETARPIFQSLMATVENNPIVLYASAMFLLNDPLTAEVYTANGSKSQNVNPQIKELGVQGAGSLSSKTRHDLKLLHLEVTRTLSRAEVYDANGKTFQTSKGMFQLGLVKHPRKAWANAQWGLVQQWIVKDDVVARKYLDRALRCLKDELHEYQQQLEWYQEQYHLELSETMSMELEQNKRDWWERGGERQDRCYAEMSESIELYISRLQSQQKLWEASRELL